MVRSNTSSGSLPHSTVTFTLSVYRMEHPLSLPACPWSPGTAGGSGLARREAVIQKVGQVTTSTISRGYSFDTPFCFPAVGSFGPFGDHFSQFWDNFPLQFQGLRDNSHSWERTIPTRGNGMPFALCAA